MESSGFSSFTSSTFSNSLIVTPRCGEDHPSPSKILAHAPAKTTHGLRPIAPRDRIRLYFFAYGREDGAHRARRARAQSQEHHLPDPAWESDGHHRCLRIGEVEPGLRHDLCRRATPIRGIALGLRPPVPGANEEAGRGRDLGPLPDDRYSPKAPQSESALDRRHADGTLRLPPIALCADWTRLLSELRDRSHPPNARDDRRSLAAVSRRPPILCPLPPPAKGSGRQRSLPTPAR